jgi:hypothetical protein
MTENDFPYLTESAFGASPTGRETRMPKNRSSVFTAFESLYSSSSENLPRPVSLRGVIVLTVGIACALTGCGVQQQVSTTTRSIPATSARSSLTPTPVPAPSNPAGDPTAISGNYTLYRQLTTCASASKFACNGNPMKITIACVGGSCTIIRTNSSSGGEPPWNHTIPLTYSGTAWVGAGREQNASICNGKLIATTAVAFMLEVTSGNVINGLWKAQQLVGTYTATQGPTKCDNYGDGKGVYVLSTTVGLVPYRYKNPKSLNLLQLRADMTYFELAAQDFAKTANLDTTQQQEFAHLETLQAACGAAPEVTEAACLEFLVDAWNFVQPAPAS